MDSHGDSVPLVHAELCGEGGERLGVLVEFCLPVASGEVESGEPLLGHGEVDENFRAGQRELVIF